MALHTDLEIHKVAEELLGLSLDMVRNIPRDLKQVVGAKIRDECLQVLVLIGRANMTRDKLPHINLLLESIWMLNYLLRALTNRGLISKGPRQSNDDDGLNRPPGQRLEEIRNRARRLRVKALLPVRQIWSSR